MHCGALRIYFISRCDKTQHFMTVLPSFHARLCRAFHSSLLFTSTSVIAILKSPLNLTFTSSKNTKPRWLNQSITIIKRRESTSSLVSERVQIALRTFCNEQNKVRSTTSVDVKLASSICFNQKGRFDYMLSRLFMLNNISYCN